MSLSGRKLASENSDIALMILVILFSLITLGVSFVLSNQTVLADSQGSPLSLSYVSNATDQNGQPLGITAVTNGFTASKITWYLNGSVAGNGTIFVLQPTKVGRYNVTVLATTSSGGSYLVTSFFYVNPPLAIASISVPKSTTDGKVTASISVYGGTPPFNYVWSLNQQTQYGCGSFSQCNLNLTKQGVNNITVTVIDRANSQVIGNAYVSYQSSTAGSSNSMLLYAGAGGGVVVIGLIAYFFVGRKKSGIEERTSAIREESGLRKPVTQQHDNSYIDKNSHSRFAQMSSEPATPVVKIVKEPEIVAPKPQSSQPGYSTYRSVYNQPKQSYGTQQQQQQPSQSQVSSRLVTGRAEQPKTQTFQQSPPTQKQLTPQPQPLNQSNAQPESRYETQPKTQTPTQPVSRPQIQTPRQPQLQSAVQPQPVNQTESISKPPAVVRPTDEPAAWIIKCVLGKDFWPAEKGPLPKSELEREFKKKFPDITLATFNSIFYDLVYKDKVSSEIINGEVLLKPGSAV